MINNTPCITIFTATYNRSALLYRLFLSLNQQTYKQFEWVIVDDGSTDNTPQIITQIKNASSFKIIYKQTHNQGKHIAINTGVALASSNCFFIVDSDDRLPENALEIIASKFTKIKDDDTVAGIVGLKCFFDKNVVGVNPLVEDTVCDIFDYRYKYNVKGDRAEILKTSVLKQYPFPRYGNEKFIPESIVWNRIAQNYNMLFFNENVYECEYLENGLSAQSVSLRRKYPKGVLHLYAELGKIKKIGFKERLKAYINFWRFYFCDFYNVKENLKLLYPVYFSMLCMPLGLFLYAKDGVLLKRKSSLKTANTIINHN